ncbi:MAG: hypothetical protein IPM25_15545 [Chloracidobacterium sp.]|nr:hypothetical protein [Chloracidobacterium sp.]
MPAVSAAQTIVVNPTGVNVNPQNPSSVFLTFGRIPPGYTAADAAFCGSLIPAAPPALGLQCRPGTIYGSRPARYDRSAASGTSALTDIMAIPASVVRRAYQTALGGGSAEFFYVRRFVSSSGASDQFVRVSCRMAGGGARVPFALTDVKFKTQDGEPVLFVESGAKFPPVSAEIRYNGTGRLKGRWEIVQPGEDPPGERDLLTEATLPIEQRGTQRRFTQVSRFNHFLPPVGKFTLSFEPPETFRANADGQYLLLLRIEVVDDKEGDSDLGAVDAGTGIVHSGAVASFPMPVLRFFVAGRSAAAVWGDSGAVLPVENEMFEIGSKVIFTWKAFSDAAMYRLQISDETGEELLSAVLVPPASSYSPPPWLADRARGRRLTWTVQALDKNGGPLANTSPRSFGLN